MKIAIGIEGGTRPETIAALAAAGVDEFFAGYVPDAWTQTYGWEVSPNRRAYGPHCQYTSLDDLRETANAVHGAGKALTVAFNAHEQRAELMPLLHELIDQVDSVEPDAYILADPALILQFREWGIPRALHLSTGTACYNSETVRYLSSLGNVRRVVLPRKMGLGEMAELTGQLGDLQVEFEALIIGYRCHFNDEYCFSWHSAKGDNLCSEFARAEGRTSRRFPLNWKQLLQQVIEHPDEQFDSGSALNELCKAVSGDGGEADLANLSTRDPDDARISSLLLSTMLVNCGLCAIPALRRAGVHVLKIPVRGTEWQKTEYVRLVRQVLERPKVTPDFCRELIGNQAFCNDAFSCYYCRSEEV